MNRKIRTLSLACVAALATCCALQASAARAEGLFVTEGHQAARIAMAGATEFRIGEFFVSCKSVQSQSEEAETLFPTAEIMVTPVFKECKGPGGVEAAVVNPCDEKDHDTTDTGKGKVDAHIDVICTGAKAGQLVAANCEVTIGSQEGLQLITFSNVASTPPSLLAKVELAKVHATVVKSGLGCPLSKGEAELTYGGETKVTATHLGKPIGLFVE